MSQQAPKKEYKSPSLAVDVIIEIDGQIVLIERKNPPHGWALPGGFVDVGEQVDDAAIREAKEETGLDVALETLLSVYSDPARDARQHVISVVYIGQASGTPVGADDAKKAELFDPKTMTETLAFDHRQILDDYLVYRERGELPPPRPTISTSE